MSTNTDSPEQEPKPLSVLAILAYSIANLGGGMFFALNLAVLPLFLLQFTDNGIILGMMGSSHSFEGAIVQPIVGSASDRLRNRLGRRRPFMLVAIPISALFLLLTPAASYLPGSAHLVAHQAAQVLPSDHLPDLIRLVTIIACVFLFTIAFNIADDPYQSMMTDITPTAQRGRVSGISMFVLVIGQASLVVLPIQLVAKFTLCAVVMCVTTALTCLTVREPKLPPEEDIHSNHPGERKIGFSSHFTELSIALSGLKILHQARLALAGLFFSGVGIGAVLSFLTVFVKTITQCTDQQAQIMFLYLMLGTALGVLPFGWLADRIGAKRVLMIGLTLISIASFFGLRVNTLGQITSVMWLAGFGNAAQSASAYPLLMQLVPSRETGFFTGLKSTALSIATPLTGLITGVLVNKGGFRSMFGVCVICLIIALVILARINIRTAKSEILARDIEQGRGGSGKDNESSARGNTSGETV